MENQHMPIRENHKYFPSFSTRQAELRAYAELRTNILDIIVPVITLTREREAPSLTASLNSVLHVANGRPVIIDFDPKPRHIKTPQEIQAERDRKAAKRIEQGETPFVPTPAMEARWAKQRAITNEFNQSLTELQFSEDGFKRWRDFSLQSPNVIPVIQSSDPAQIPAQVLAIKSADRKMAFRIDVTDPGSLNLFLIAAPHLDRADRAILIFDAGQIRGSVSGAEARITEALKSVKINIPHLFYDMTKICMAGSFPSSLKDHVSPLDIEERALFDRVVSAGWNVRYGDYSSVQPRSEQAGGDGYYAHLEVAHPRQWYFERSQKKNTSAAFVTCAANLVSTPVCWSGRSVSWGTYMVERASKGQLDDGGRPPQSFRGPGPWVGPRVSQHITQQALHP